MSFKKYIRQLSIAFTLLFLASFFSCKPTKKTVELPQKEINSPFFKLSLAQWSLNKQIRSGEMSPLDFAQKANELGFEGIEYVSQLYSPELKKEADLNAAMQNLLKVLKEKSETYKVQNLLIMVDGEGNLATDNKEQRNLAVENHKKWVDAAQFLGCHSIRVNLNGSNDPDIWIKASTNGLSKLATYASTKNINVIVENHGGLSSNAGLLVKVIEKVNLPNCGVLPDFGNFCMQHKGSKCIKEYDKYKGVEEMMPYAKAVSAKSYDFDENGNETTIDYIKMLKIVKESGYTGFIGVEYEGSRLSETEGALATKNLLIKAANQLK
ncbi:MAG: sugar phosphate isomerase/epimerase [Bacteroidetes bacterium]|nr:sugar phosphate isomerase/epimerase [Bacteroidota bacterium]